MTIYRFVRVLSLSLVYSFIFSQLAIAAVEDLNANYKAAEHDFISNNYSASQEKLQKIFTTTDAKDPANMQTLARAHNLQGLINFQLKNINAAVEEFSFATNLASANFPDNDPALHLVRYNLANALQQSGRTEESAQILSTILPSSLDLDTRIRFFHLQGGVSLAKDEPLLATQAFLRAAAASKDPLATQTFLQRAHTASKHLFLLRAQEDLNGLEEMIPEFAINPTVALALDFFRARGYLRSGSQDKASDLLNKFLQESSADHPLRLKVEELLHQTERLTVVDATTIGLLLPLSGKFAKFGRMNLNAIFMALGAFENMRQEELGSSLRFAIQDSGDSIESAQMAFDQLVFSDHAIAVIGPLLSKQSSVISQRAQEYGVPLLSLSQKNDQNSLGSFIFPIALSPEQQIKTIVDHAINVRHLQRFAIMAPSDSFGEDYTRMFWDAVEAGGGKIIGLERYEPHSTDFRDTLEDLLGFNQLDARTLEIEELNRRKELFATTLKAKGLTRKRMLLAFDAKPLVQFDAVFIADDPKIVGQIAPTFAVLDAEGIQLLGINTWNSPEIIQRAGRYVQNSIFVDAFFPQSTEPKVKQFNTDFQQYFGVAPGALEVQAYDAARILITTLNGTAPQTRSQLQQAIFSYGKYLETSGKYEFQPGSTNRSSYLLTVKGNVISEVLTR